MEKKLPKVLMLGWEFPPIINGGLGVACHDLSAAMSEFVDITMIVPKSSPGFKVKNVNLMGVNNIDIRTIEERIGHRKVDLPFELYSIPMDLDPYQTENLSWLERKNDIRFFLNRRENLYDFKIDNLYGGDVIKKVYQFADITSIVASGLEFDIIHAHDWMTILAGIRIKQITGKPLVVHIHSLEIDRSGENSKGWVYELEKKGMNCADLLIPVSNFTANNIHQYYGISKNKMSVVHNGSSTIKPLKNEKKVKEKIVLFVGRLTRQKGPLRFLEIAAKVLEKDPNVRFVMAGVGDYFKAVLEQSSYKNIGNRFHMTGFLNFQKLNHLFSISDVYCMPSLSEPFGLSAVEAAHFGIPCVISKQSGVAEVLTGSLKFDYWDTSKAADCILNLLNNKVLRKKVVEDASINLNNITWELSARKVLNAYATIN